MTEKESRLKRIIWGMIAAVCPVLITSIGLFMRNMLPGQQLKLVYGDYLNEYLPFFKHFWDSVFQGKSLEYSFSMGMGSPTLAMYSVFAYSPFSIIPYLIKDITLAGYISWMLKLPLISLSIMYFLMKDIKCKRVTAVIFSLFYSLSSYVIIYHNNIHYMDILYIMPVLIHFIIRYVKEEKVTGLVLMYAFSFINNFFVGFCTGLYSFVIYILLLWYYGIWNERLKNNLIKYFLIVLTASLLSMPVILPAVMFVLQHMPNGSDFSVIPLRSLSYILNSFLFGRKIRGIFDTMPALYCGWPSIILCIAFFAGKADKRKKILAGVPLVLLFICCFWHPAYFFMHLCNEPDSFPWRFSYLLIFSFVCVAAYEYDRSERKVFSSSRIIAFVVIIVAGVAAYLLNRGELAYNGYIPVSILVINMVIVVLYFIGDVKKTLFYIVAISEMICCVYFQLPYTDSSGQEDIRDEFKRADTVMNIIEEDSMAFHRNSVFSGLTLNQSLLYDYPGMDYFCSFDNEALNNTLMLLGLRARAQQYNNYGNTEFTNMIFDIKYSGSTPSLKLNENSPVLPLAFSVSEDIKKIVISDNPFENQQALADSMTVEDHVLFKPVETEFIANDAIDIVCDNDMNGYTFIKRAEGAQAVWYLNESEVQPTYIYISTGIRGTGMFDKEGILSGDPIRTETPLSIPIMNKFFVKKGESRSAVYLNMNGDIGSEATITEIMAGSLDMDVIRSIYEELLPNGLTIDSFRDDRIYGRVKTDSEHTVLFSSIPYDINWHVMIDGKECETYAVFNGTFLACDITPGEHEVEYVYKDSAFTMGLAGFAVGILLFILIIKNNSKKQMAITEEVTEKESGQLTRN